LVTARGSTLLEVDGIGPSSAARLLADVGDIHRFADRDRFASWNVSARPRRAGRRSTVRDRRFCAAHRVGRASLVAVHDGGYMRRGNSLVGHVL
jgi:transposase